MRPNSMHNALRHEGLLPLGQRQVETFVGADKSTPVVVADVVVGAATAAT